MEVLWLFGFPKFADVKFWHDGRQKNSESIKYAVQGFKCISKADTGRNLHQSPVKGSIFFLNTPYLDEELAKHFFQALIFQMKLPVGILFIPVGKQLHACMLLHAQRDANGNF